MTASELYGQIQGIQGELNPMLDLLPQSGQYYRDAVNRAFEYNRPAIQNAAALEGELYALPGNLMSQYYREFGDGGISSSQKINSILQNLGRQSALSNTAWGVADQSGMRINDLAKTLLDQYKLGIEARQAKLSPLLAMWERIYSEEQANKRARGGGGSSWVNPFKDIVIGGRVIQGAPGNETTQENWNAGANRARAGSSTNIPFPVPQRTTLAPASTSSPLFNRLVNQYRGISNIIGK